VVTSKDRIVAGKRGIGGSRAPLGGGIASATFAAVLAEYVERIHAAAAITRATYSAQQILTPTDGGKLAAAYGEIGAVYNLLNNRGKVVGAGRFELPTPSPPVCF
jgi:hypothetical protein